MIKLFRRSSAAGENSPPEVVWEGEEQRSLIGATVHQLNRLRDNQIGEEQRITEEIAALVEERRQRRTQIVAMTAALAAIGEDPALTVDEKETVKEGSEQYINSIDVGLE